MSEIILQKLRSNFADALLDLIEHRGELTAVVKNGSAHDLLKFLKEDPELDYKMLIDITAVDNSQMEDLLIEYDYARFMIVYHLNSITSGDRFRVKVPISEDQKIETVTDLWRSANWLERETSDMFGVKFKDHPDPRRILMPDDFDGYPLRKDYPLRGRGERENFNFERQNA